MRRSVVITVAAILAIASPLVAYAVGRASGSGVVNAQTVAVHSKTVTTDAVQYWTNVPFLSDISICAVGPITVLVSLLNHHESFPQVRVALDNTVTVPPGPIQVGLGERLSYAFVATQVAAGLHRIDLQWLYWNGDPGLKNEYSNGSMTVLYDDPGDC